MGMNKKRQLWIASGCMVVSLVFFAYMGIYTRYLADDFCVAYKAQQFGVIGSAVDWYTTWAGQYTNWLIKGVAGQLGTGFAMILPAIIVAGWAGAASWMFYQMGKLLQFQKPGWIAIVLGTGFTYALFGGAPDVIQSLYWLSASIPYTLPLLALMFYVGFFFLMLRKHAAGKFPVWALIFTAVLTFIAGGTSESYVLFQGAVLGFMFIGVLIFAPTPMKKNGLWLLGIGVVFSGLSFIAILIAPGNAIRQSSFGATLPVSEIISRTLRVTASFFATDIGVFSTIPLLVALILPALLISQFTTFERPLLMTPRRARVLMALSLGIALVLVLIVIGPPIYATSVAPAPRVYLAAHLVMICTAGFWGCVIGLGIKRPGLGRDTRAGLGVLIVLGLLMAVGPLLTAAQTLGRTPDYQLFASDWDARDSAIRAAAASGEQVVQVAALGFDLAEAAHLDTLTDDPEWWVNICAADYYGVESIVVRES
jgi:hypothetical protein